MEPLSRRILMITLFAARNGILSSALVILGQEPPHAMTKLVVRLESSDTPEDSFAAKPKTRYRAGNGYCRIEEMPDDEQGIHGLVIINEPDIWMVNLFTKTARHYVDSGPTFNCRMPMFQGDQIKSSDDTKNPILDLEFGRDIEYFKSKEVASKPGPVLRDKPTTAYALEVGDSQLLLFTTGTPEQPWAVARRSGKTRDIFWYATYEQLPFDPKLFAKPADVKIEEVK
jgi:hypothetical protein